MINSEQNKKRLKLGSRHKMPSIVRWYLVIRILFPIFFLSIALSLVSIPFSILFLFFGILLIIYGLLAYEFIDFVIEKNRVTVNYGIIIKHSTTISFDNIQSVKNKRGILEQILGISNLKAWTASPEKINVEDRRKEDIDLYLLKKDADWLKEFIHENNK